MKGRPLTAAEIAEFTEHLVLEERSAATVEKYVRDVRAFAAYALDGEITKETVIAYKKHLQEIYAVRSVNSMLASINCLFTFLGWHDLKVKTLKLQQHVYCPEEKELTKAEYTRLCRAAMRKHNERLCLILQTICGTGIRVSELQFITIEAARCGEAVVSCKAKTPDGVSCEGAEAKIAPLCSGARNRKRNNFRDPHGKAGQSDEPMEGNEGAMHGGRCQPSKSISAQPAPPVRPGVLRHRKGHCQAGRHSRSLKHRYDPRLYHFHRHGAPPPHGEYAPNFISNRIPIML